MFHQGSEKRLVSKLAVAMLASLMFLSVAAPVFAEDGVQVDPAPQTPNPTNPSPLQLKIAVLKRENRRLTARNEYLRAKSARLNTLNRNLNAENTQLRGLVTTLKDSLARMRAMYLSTLNRLRALLRRLARMFGAWHSARASWYGPGLYGSPLASGGVLRPGMRIFAHRSMRFGTRVQFAYNGRRIIAVCRDRGPYVGGRTFDLGPGTARALRFDGVGTVRWRIVRG